MNGQQPSLALFKKPLPVSISRTGWALLLFGAMCYAGGYLTDARHASFVQLVNFLFVTSIGVGALFLVALEYIAGSVWSVPFRRINEFLALLIPLAALMAVPLFPPRRSLSVG